MFIKEDLFSLRLSNIVNQILPSIPFVPVKACNACTVNHPMRSSIDLRILCQYTILATATPGQEGTTLAQTAWLPVLRTLGTLPWFGGRLMVSDAEDIFDPAGKLIDEATKRRLTAFMTGFAGFISERHR
jgi:hypothetical protein